MPVKGKVKKVAAKVEEEDLEDEEIEETEPEEEEETEGEDEDDNEGEGENGEDTASTGKRGRGRPKGGSRTPGFPWTDSHRARLIRTMEKVQSGDLRGGLTPEAVLQHLAEHPKFVASAHLLTPAAIVAEAKKIAKALQDEGIDVPVFPGRNKIDPARLKALLAADEDDEEESED